MNGANDFQGAFGISDRRSHQGCFKSALLTVSCPRRSVPGRGHNRLPVGNSRILDHAPVAQRAARRFTETHTTAFFGPRLRFPEFHVGSRFIAATDIGHQIINVLHHLVRGPTTLKRASRVAPERGVHRFKRQVQFI